MLAYLTGVVRENNVTSGQCCRDSDTIRITQNVLHLHKLFLGRERGGARPGDRAQGAGGRGLDRCGGEAKGLSRQQGKIEDTVSKKQFELKTETPLPDVWGWVIFQVWILEQVHRLWRKEPNVQTELQHQDGWKQKPQAVLTNQIDL